MSFAPISFNQFSELQDELALHILSFVATVPYERSTLDHRSTLCHTFPLVCKHFNAFCKDYIILWKICVERIIQKRPELWGWALTQFIDANSTVLTGESDENNIDNDEEGNGQHYHTTSVLHSANPELNRACRLLQNILRSNANVAATTRTSPRFGIHGEIYKYLLSNYIRYTAPVFYMPDESIARDQPFGLHLFEPRYRRLIHEVMEPYQDQITDNGAVYPSNARTFPMFIYGNKSPLKRGQSAVIVRVLNCIFHENGTSDVYLVPIQHGRVERIWEQMDYNDHLYFARMMRMSAEEQQILEMEDAHRKFPMMTARMARGGYANDVLRLLERRTSG